MATTSRCWLGALLALLVVGAPLAYYRATYERGKRLRVVTAGRVYRSGQLTAAGLTQAVQRLGIRTVINLQEEAPDPAVRTGWLARGTVPESELCRRLGVRFICLPPDLLPPGQTTAARPVAIDRLLALLDDPEVYPVLLHCRAGLHRTGIMTAVYRMEYEQWDKRAALQELRRHGFGEYACNPANEYIRQYILNYRAGQRQASVVRGP